MFCSTSLRKRSISFMQEFFPVYGAGYQDVGPVFAHIGNEIKDTDERREGAIHLRIRALLVVHVFDADSGGVEFLMFQIIPGAVPGDIVRTAEGPNDFEHS